MQPLRRTLGRLLAAAVAAATVLAPATALADYQMSNGYVVHWAGGNNIVVTDANGTTVYTGRGVQVGGHLYMPGTVPGQNGAPAPTAPVQGACGFTCGGSSPPVNQTTTPWQNHNPYSYAPQLNALQPVQLDPALARQLGVTTTQYAAVYQVPGVVGGYSAIPATSQLGQALAARGFAVQNGWVLLHDQPGVSWQAQTAGAPGSNLYSVSQVCQTCLGGGVITISGAILGGPPRAAPVTYSWTPPAWAPPPPPQPVAVTGVAFNPNPVQTGTQVTATVSTSGPVRSVVLNPPWGGAIQLSGGGSTWTGTFDAPAIQGNVQTFTVNAVATGDQGQQAQGTGQLTVWRILSAAGSVPTCAACAPGSGGGYTVQSPGGSIAPNPPPPGSGVTATTGPGTAPAQLIR